MKSTTILLVLTSGIACGDTDEARATFGDPAASGLSGLGEDGSEPTDGNGDADDDDDDSPGDAGDDDDDDAADDGPKFDAAVMPDLAPGTGCGGSGDGGGGDLEFSYIWIANSTQNTISKIDTVTMVEEGRYYTRETGGNPSRTSVNLSGDVAVANRQGGLTKFYARAEDCTDLDGNGVIDSSTGVDDVLPWGTEECMAWFTPFQYSSQRPVAWTAGTLDESTCEYEDQKVWTTGVHAGQIEVVRVDGETGVVEDSVMIPEVPAGALGFGFYGGAVDAAGNFWTTKLHGGALVRTNYADLSYKVYDQPHGGYGMTVGSQGYIWTCSTKVGRFDPVAETWTGVQVGGSGGCMEDGNGTLWMANDPLVAVDTTTLTVVQTVDLPKYVRGVSVDFHGNVWAVSIGTDAYRVDPATGAFETLTGLTGAYTYSDMTGFALGNVSGIPTG